MQQGQGQDSAVPVNMSKDTESETLNEKLEFYINGCAILAAAIFGILGEYFAFIVVSYQAQVLTKSKTIQKIYNLNFKTGAS